MLTLLRRYEFDRIWF